MQEQNLFQISKQIYGLATDYTSSNSPASSGVCITDISTVDFGVPALEPSTLLLLRCFAFTGVLNNSAIPKMETNLVIANVEINVLKYPITRFKLICKECTSLRGAHIKINHYLQHVTLAWSNLKTKRKLVRRLYFKHKLQLSHKDWAPTETSLWC